MGPFRRTRCKSGASKKKAKARAEKLKNSLRGSMNKYLVSNNNIHEEPMNDSDEEWEKMVNEMEENGDFLLENDENAHGQNEEAMGQEMSPPNTHDVQREEDPSGEELSLSDTNEIVQDEVEHKEHGPVNIYDPGNWGTNISPSVRDILVKKGPIREIDKNFWFPLDKYNRCFNHDHYIRKMENGESWDRKWLVYSSIVDRVFCFCCKLCKQDGKKFQLDTKGSKDWKNVSAKLSAMKLLQDIL